MILYDRFKKAIRSLLDTGNKSGYGTRSGKGGVDAGRDSFINLETKENKQKRNLLRKINLYRLGSNKSDNHLFKETPVRNWRRKSLLGVCLIVAAGLFVNLDGLGNIRQLLKNLGYFHITSIEVKGCINTSTEKVRNSSGIILSSSLFSLDDEKISEAIRSENKWVNKIEIIRSWPDEVVVQVMEYEPVALVGVNVDGVADLYYMDKNGKAFIKTTVGMDLDFPVMTGIELTNNTADPIKLEEALTFLTLIRRNNPNLPSQSVSEINVNVDEGLVVHMVEYPFPIFFGQGEVRKKYYKLRKVLERLYKYKPGKSVMGIADVAYIRMDYLDNKVLVGYRRNIESG